MKNLILYAFIFERNALLNVIASQQSTNNLLPVFTGKSKDYKMSIIPILLNI